jgi:15-cis-phytoene synthase
MAQTSGARPKPWGAAKKNQGDKPLQTADVGGRWQLVELTSPTIMQSAFTYCENLVREADRDRFLATLFAPAECRGALFALYAFNVEVSGVRERIRDPMAGYLRLQWWRDVLDGTRDAGGHPTASAMREVVSRHALSIDRLHNLLEARTFDLHNDPMPGLAALDAYARETSSTLMALAMHILGNGEAASPRPAVPAGVAYAITGLLRALPRHSARGQVFVPEEVLSRHGIDRETILSGHMNEGVASALRELRGYARRQLETAREPLAALPTRLIPALLPVALVRLYLDRMDGPDYDPFVTPVEVPQWRRQWVLWRASRASGRIAAG